MKSGDLVQVGNRICSVPSFCERCGQPAIRWTSNEVVSNTPDIIGWCTACLPEADERLAKEEARRKLWGQVKELHYLVGTINHLSIDRRLAEPARRLAYDAAAKASSAYFAAEALYQELGRTG